MKTEVLKRSSMRFDMTGRSLGYHLHITGDSISDGLARRLEKYALDRLRGFGFYDVVRRETFVVGAREIGYWAVEAYTMDAEEKPSDRSYCVRFINRAGGYIEVIGILVSSHGWPCIDHGLAIGELSDYTPSE